LPQPYGQEYASFSFVSGIQTNENWEIMPWQNVHSQNDLVTFQPKPNVHCNISTGTVTDCRSTPKHTFSPTNYYILSNGTFHSTVLFGPWFIARSMLSCSFISYM
jgi:hypothetical protein